MTALAQNPQDEEVSPVRPYTEAGGETDVAAPDVPDDDPGRRAPHGGSRHWLEPVSDQLAEPLPVLLQAALQGGPGGPQHPDPAIEELLKQVRDLRAGTGERIVVDRLDGLLDAMIAGAGCTTQASIELRHDLELTRQQLATINVALIKRRRPIAEVTAALNAGEPLL